MYRLTAKILYMRNDSTAEEADNFTEEEETDNFTKAGIQRHHGGHSRPLLCDALGTLLWLLLST